MAHVSEAKKKVVSNIVKLVKEYPIVGTINMENLPGPQLQAMRAQLRGKVVLAMTKRRIMKIALEKVKDEKKGIEKLEEHLKGMPALIFTKESPFKLSKILQKNKSSAPAKAGQTAPSDIVVNKGSTGFAPGPIIGELGMIGIKTGVENGKVVVKEDTVVVKEGQQIKPKVAEILTRLGIEPMEVGLDLTAAYEDGLIYNLNTAAKQAFNLAFDITWATKSNISLLIGKAFNDAKALGLSENIIDKDIIGELLSKAERSSLSLKEAANIEVAEKEKKIEAPKPEVKKQPEPVKEAPKAEEKKPEVKTKPEVKKEEAPKPEVKEEKKPEPPKVEEKVEVKEVKEKPKEVKIEEQETKEKLKPKPDVQKEPKPEVKEKPEEKKIEAPKPEVRKVEEKKVEVKKPKDEEKPKPKGEKPIEEKISEMVKKTKDFSEGKEKTADNLLKEVEQEKEEEKNKEELREKKLGEEKTKKEGEELAKKQKERREKQKEEEKKKQKEVEELTKELIKKGTLRKS